jgi:hypothetical protein
VADLTKHLLESKLPKFYSKVLYSLGFSRIAVIAWLALNHYLFNILTFIFMCRIKRSFNKWVQHVKYSIAIE